MASKYKTLFFPKGDHPLFPGKKWVGEHRVLMAEKLGRSLGPDDLVHHRDENPANNAIDNLELIRRGDHSRLHNTGRTRTESERLLTSQALKGRILTPEHLEKMKKAATGKRLSPETRLLLSNMSAGVPKSKETKARMQASWTPERREQQAQRMRNRKAQHDLT